MAIVVERIEGSTDLIKTYSNKGMMIQQEQTGDMYGEAIDVDYTGYTYVETDIPIDTDEDDESEESSDSEILDILLGREDENNETEDN